jgi:hypothetical protein
MEMDNKLPGIPHVLHLNKMRHRIRATNWNVEGDCISLVSGMRGSREREESEKLVDIIMRRKCSSLSIRLKFV